MSAIHVLLDTTSLLLCHVSNKASPTAPLTPANKTLVPFVPLATTQSPKEHLVPRLTSNTVPLMCQTAISVSLVNQATTYWVTLVPFKTLPTALHTLLISTVVPLVQPISY